MTTLQAIKHQVAALHHQHCGKPITITKVMFGCRDEEDLHRMVKEERYPPNVTVHYIIGLDENGHIYD